MKRSITYRITALVLACMVFLSTSMNSMSLHYCESQLASVSLFNHDHSPNTCCTTVIPGCEKTNGDDNCCTYAFINLDWDTDIAIQYVASLDSGKELFAILHTNDGLINNSPQSISTPQSYLPPLPTEDRTIFFQQFLL